jgi:hypothetical protein
MATGTELLNKAAKDEEWIESRKKLAILAIRAAGEVLRAVVDEAKKFLFALGLLILTLLGIWHLIAEKLK